MAAWTDFRERMAGDEIHLTPAQTKHWELRSHEGMPLSPKRLLLRPAEFPIWIAVPLSATAGSVTLAVSRGDLQLWANGDGVSNKPGFVLSWGTVSDQTADGPLRSPEKATALRCRGGKGKACLRWFRRESFGLDAEVALLKGTKALLAPGVCTLAYRRPVGSTQMGEFVGQSYTLTAKEPDDARFRHAAGGGGRSSPLEARPERQSRAARAALPGRRQWASLVQAVRRVWPTGQD